MKHFTVEELCRTSTGLDNEPPDTIKDNLIFLIEHVLDPIRDQFGPVRITSGYRSAAVNKAVGGAKNSGHTRGECADIQCNNGDLLPVAQWIADNLSFDQLILESWDDNTNRAGWIHIGIKKSGNRKEILTMRKVKGKSTYSVGLPIIQ